MCCRDSDGGYCTKKGPYSMDHTAYETGEMGSPRFEGSRSNSNSDSESERYAGMNSFFYIEFFEQRIFCKEKKNCKLTTTRPSHKHIYRFTSCVWKLRETQVCFNTRLPYFLWDDAQVH
ncbi:hypothetical protein L914_16289 [Phytophthora nicotianae]|uniref:Uncharacterized protein n=2 Tax=Phytophthora nicotianae TaxID=4792 RepID=W2ML93_PHYNI|nr:hypothetical protein L914_16289 [Phytophthora nicotianae]